MDQPSDAQAAYERAIGIFQSLVAEFPGVWQYRPYLSRAYRELASLLTSAGRTDEAHRARRAAEQFGQQKTGSTSDEAEALGLE